MSRNRKTKTQTQAPDSINPSVEESLEIPDDEAWRLINGSGLLSKAIPSSAATPTNVSSNAKEDLPLAEEIFNAVTLIIPFSFLLMMMEILIHQQYGKHPTFSSIIDRMAPSIPILSLFIFYTTRYKTHRAMQVFLFVLSILVGPRMVYLINRGSWLVNMRQCPPLATIWIYAIVQLDLGFAVLNLIVVGGWAWWKGMKLFHG